MSAIDFSGRTALVTGGTRGIGEAIADGLRAGGARVIATGTNQAEVEGRNRDLTRRGEDTGCFRLLDFTNAESVRRFLDGLSDDGRIDICINNAGTNRIQPVEDVSPADYEFLMKVNLEGPFLVSQRVCELMRPFRYGRIVNIASIWSVVTRAHRSVYTTTKSGLVGLTRCLAVEMAPHNILVNCVSPGFTVTELTRASLTEAQQQELAGRIPMGRLARPEEISRVVLFLASQLNTYLTGQNIVVDGGFASV